MMPYDWKAAAAIAVIGSAYVGIFLFVLRGIQAKFPEKVADWLFPFLLGTLELSAYPVLIHEAHQEYIGGWLALKTLAHWQEWKKRPVYNRFLIGNGLILILAWVLERWLPPVN